jgi:Mn2+/Fe2+ NRAMP family transporter
MPVVSLWKSGNHLEHYRCLKRSGNQNQHTRFGDSWGVLGPGFITGASDDDPSGIGTYAVAKASTGSSTLWLALATFPMMAAIQFICAKIAMVTGGDSPES